MGQWEKEDGGGVGVGCARIFTADHRRVDVVVVGVTRIDAARACVAAPQCHVRVGVTQTAVALQGLGRYVVDDVVAVVVDVVAYLLARGHAQGLAAVTPGA